MVRPRLANDDGEVTSRDRVCVCSRGGGARSISDPLARYRSTAPTTATRRTAGRARAPRRARGGPPTRSSASTRRRSSTASAVTRRRRTSPPPPRTARSSSTRRTPSSRATSTVARTASTTRRAARTPRVARLTSPRTGAPRPCARRSKTTVTTATTTTASTSSRSRTNLVTSPTRASAVTRSARWWAVSYEQQAAPAEGSKPRAASRPP